MFREVVVIAVAVFEVVAMWPVEAVGETLVLKSLPPKYSGERLC